MGKVRNKCKYVQTCGSGDNCPRCKGFVRKWHNVSQIAQYIGVSKETIYRLLDRGEIPAHRLGKLWLFDASEIDQYIKASGKQGGSNE